MYGTFGKINFPKKKWPSNRAIALRHIVDSNTANIYNNTELLVTSLVEAKIPIIEVKQLELALTSDTLKKMLCSEEENLTPIELNNVIFSIENCGIADSEARDIIDDLLYSINVNIVLKNLSALKKATTDKKTTKFIPQHVYKERFLEIRNSIAEEAKSMHNIIVQSEKASSEFVQSLKSNKISFNRMLEEKSLSALDTAIEEEPAAETPTTESAIKILEKVDSAYSDLHPKKNRSSEILEELNMYAECGISEANYILSVLYRSGIWVREDKNLAKQYVQKAADGGYPPAFALLGDIEYSRNNFDMAYEYYSKPGAIALDKERSERMNTLFKAKGFATKVYLSLFGLYVIQILTMWFVIDSLSLFGTHPAILAIFVALMTVTMICISLIHYRQPMRDLRQWGIAITALFTVYSVLALL